MKTTNFNPQNYYIDILNQYVEVYKKEKGFINGHNNDLDTAPVIVILGDFSVLPLYWRCSMNPLSIKRKDDTNANEDNRYLRLSTCSIGGTFVKTHETWEESINAFNDGISNWIIPDNRYAIVAYVELD